MGLWSQDAPLNLRRFLCSSFFEMFMTRIFNISSVSVLLTR